MSSFHRNISISQIFGPLPPHQDFEQRSSTVDGTLATMPAKAEQKIIPGTQRFVQPKEKTNAHWLFDNGYKNLKEFMTRYGLDIEREEDKDEAKNLIDCFRMVQQAEFEEYGRKHGGGPA